MSYHSNNNNNINSPIKSESIEEKEEEYNQPIEDWQIASQIDDDTIRSSEYDSLKFEMVALKILVTDIGKQNKSLYDIIQKQQKELNNLNSQYQSMFINFTALKNHVFGINEIKYSNNNDNNNRPVVPYQSNLHPRPKRPLGANPLNHNQQKPVSRSISVISDSEPPPLERPSPSFVKPQVYSTEQLLEMLD